FSLDGPPGVGYRVRHGIEGVLGLRPVDCAGFHSERYEGGVMTRRTSRFERTLFHVLMGCSLLLGFGTARAQEVNRTLYGRVVDATDLALPGATVTITSPQLIKGAQVLVTNEKGQYRAPLLPPGIYSVKAEMSGFQTSSSDDIQLKAGAALSIDFALKVA